jgi:hypothetical protein
LSQHPSPRRDFILRLVAGGTFGAAGLSGFMSRALARGDLPAASGVHQIQGSATVNGRPAKAGTPLAGTEKVATGPASMSVLVIRDDAFLLRENTSIEFAGSKGVVSSVLIETGRALAVFGKKPMTIRAANTSIGIRGTGAYFEVDLREVYFCLCYGEADVDGPGMPTPIRVKTTHHEQPLLLTETGGVMKASPGAFRNHTDEELTMLEALVGREPPFKGVYPAGKY